MTPAQKKIMGLLPKYKKIMVQHEDGLIIHGFENGPAVNKRSVSCLVRDNHLKPCDLDIEGKPMTYVGVH